MLRKDSTSGEPCVSWHKGSQLWRVQIIRGKRVVFYEYFKSKDKAIQVAREKRADPTLLK